MKKYLQLFLFLILSLSSCLLLGQSSPPNYCSSLTGNDSYACNLNPAITTYSTGRLYLFLVDVANTGTASINFNSLGAKTIVKAAGGITTVLADNDIRAGQMVILEYDGTNMQMQSTLGNVAGGGGGNSGCTNSNTPNAGWVCLESHTASSSASLAFTTCINASYDDYAIRIINLIPGTSAVTILLQFSTDGGSTYDTSTNYVYSALDYSQSGVNAFPGNGSATGIALFAGLGTTSNWSLNGSWQGVGLGSALYKSIIGGGAALSSDTNFYRFDSAGVWKNTTAANAFRLISTSGTILSGIARCYGISH